MKKTLKITAFLLALAFIGCQKDVQQQPEEPSNAPLGARVSSSATYLKVVVHNEGASIQSDDKGELYEHGVDRVDARILSDGIFFFQTNTTDTKEPLRKLIFTSPESYPYAMNGKRNYTFRTNKSLLSIYPGGTDVMGLTIRGINSKGAVDWLLLYRNGAASTDLQTDLVRVKRGSGTEENTWWIEPANELPYPANAALYDANSLGNATGNASYHVVQFRLTISKK